MDSITYKAVHQFDKYHVRMDDPVFGHPWYLKGVRNGRYEWSAASLWGKTFSLETAQRHIQDLENGADKSWPDYHDHWKNYYIEIGVIKEAQA